MAAPPLHLRVFLSSPGDVAEERDLARKLIKDELPYDPFLRDRVTFDGVSWDDPAARIPMLADLTPQESVNRGMPKPSACDIVVVVLWGRMGTPLPDSIRKPSGEPYLSGTEWEYEDALASPREPKPEVLVYRRTEEPKIGLADPDLDQKREQYARVERFFERFRNPDGSLAGGFDTYATPDEFAEKLRSHLRNLLERRLSAALHGQDLYQETDAAEVVPGTLAAAEARLAALPLDTIPDAGPLPPGSRMPQGRNPLFVGRADDLKALAAALKAGETAAVGQIAAATGLGGIGKTQLANEFVHRYGRYFQGGVFWLGFADPAAVPAEIAGCGAPGALELHPEFGKLSLDDQLRLVLAAWQSPLPRLLVFDNCEDEALLAAWRPPTGGCRVLVTSRRAEWSPELGVHGVPLGVLSRDESLALLRRYRPDLAGDGDLDAIAEELGDLPLALHVAGSYLARYRHAESGRPAAYLAELRRPDLLKHRSLTAGGYSPTGHEQHVARTFALSYDRLRPDDPTDAAALALLARAACFAPGEPIPRDLLRASLQPGEEDDAEAELRAEDALGRLGELGLLEARAAGAVVLHRLVAAFVRREAGERMAEAQAAVEEAVLDATYRLNQAGYPAPLLAWQPHLRAVAEAAAA